MSSSNFSINFASHTVSLQQTNAPSETTVTVNGKTYALLGKEADILLLRALIQSTEFRSFKEFKATLKASLDSSEKIQFESQRILGIPSTKSITLKEELESTMPKGAGAMVTIYEKGKKNTLLLGQTSAVNVSKNYPGPQPVNEQTAALIGSGAKMFTALLCKVLEEKKVLSLKSKLSDFMREEHFQMFEQPELAKEITLEMLLSHTSGLQYFSADDNDARKDQSLDKIFSNMPKSGIRFIAEPGDDIYSYSNHIELAAIFVEKSYKKKLAKDKYTTLTTKIDQLEEHLAILKREKEGVQGVFLNSQIEATERELAQLKTELQKYPSNFLELLEENSAYINGNYIYDMLDAYLGEDAFLTYGDIMKRELLDPLEMSRTSFKKPEDENVLRAYKDGQAFDKEVLDPLMRGAGGLWSSMGDIIKLVDAYQEDGLKTRGNKILIPQEGLKDTATRRGINGSTGLAINIDGPLIGKGGSIASYGFNLEMDPLNRNAIISMCNFIDDKKEFDTFQDQVQEVLDRHYPSLKHSKIDDSTLTPKEAALIAEGYPMQECEQFFKGDRGYVGLKRTVEEPGLILNWNGQTLPVRKLAENQFLILDKIGYSDGKGGYPDGQVLQILEGKHSKKTYVFIEKTGETNAFQAISKNDLFFTDNNDFLEEIKGATGIYTSKKENAPTFKFEVNKANECLLTLDDFNPAKSLITHIEHNNGEISEIHLQANCGPFPPDKLFKISRGNLVRQEIEAEIVQTEVEIEKLYNENSKDKIAEQMQHLSNLKITLEESQNVEWFLRVADFINPNNNLDVMALKQRF
jgi:CubicO group peptidase (beta-lactamase class C family)